MSECDDAAPEVETDGVGGQRHAQKEAVVRAARVGCEHPWWLGDGPHGGDAV